MSLAKAASIRFLTNFESSIKRKGEPEWVRLVA